MTAAPVARSPAHRAVASPPPPRRSAPVPVSAGVVVVAPRCRAARSSPRRCRPRCTTPSLAPAGAVGYVVCPNAVTPVELATHTAEAGIPLPISGPRILGNFAIATSPDGRWAYVVTTDGVTSSPLDHSTTLPSVTSATTGATATTGGHRDAALRGERPERGHPHRPGHPAGREAHHDPGPGRHPRHRGHARGPDRAGRQREHRRPGGRRHPPGRDPARPRPRPTIFGMALDPARHRRSTPWWPAGWSRWTRPTPPPGIPIPTGLSVSSVYSPHGIVVTADGATVYVVGQGGADYGGRVLPIVASTGTPGPWPASTNSASPIRPPSPSTRRDARCWWWTRPTTGSTRSRWPRSPTPPRRCGCPATGPGTGHPTDIVFGPGNTGAFVVDGFNAVIPYQPGSQTFGRPIPVCAGASSMAVAPAP